MIENSENGGTFMAVKGIWVGLGIVGLVTALIVHLFMTTYYQISVYCSEIALHKSKTEKSYGKESDAL